MALSILERLVEESKGCEPVSRIDLDLAQCQLDINVAKKDRVLSRLSEAVLASAIDEIYDFADAGDKRAELMIYIAASNQLSSAGKEAEAAPEITNTELDEYVKALAVKDDYPYQFLDEL